ncbi:MAG: HEAT repeat domain-containing protein [Planctomycetes bacterium]|nr:HEAT repeat domain-containing protein [Planctomycetota bacterium]
MVTSRGLRVTSLGIFILLLSACSVLTPETSRKNELFRKLDEYVAQYNYALSSPNRDVLGMVEEELSKIARKDREVLVTALKDFKNDYEQGLAAFAIGFLPEPGIHAKLLPLLEKGSLKVKYNALGSVGILARKGFARFVDFDQTLFLRLMEEPDYEIISGSLFALKHMMTSVAESPEIISRTRKLVFHPHPRVRNEAIALVGVVGCHEAYEDIIKSRFDSQPLIRRNAAVAAGMLKMNEAVPDLIEFLIDPDTDVVKAAHTWLVKITGKNYGPSYSLWKERYTEWLAELLRYYSCSVHPDQKEPASGRCKICKRQLIPKEMIYLCEVHTDVLKGEPGSCPQCGVKLVIKEKPIEPDAHYYCPAHRDVIKFEEGNCPVCSKPLQRKGKSSEK